MMGGKGKHGGAQGEQQENILKKAKHASTLKAHDHEGRKARAKARTLCACKALIHASRPVGLAL
eukprot:3219511-Pleurochrysis_carterae.AAC.2